MAWKDFNHIIYFFRCIEKFSGLEEEDNFTVDLILSQTILGRTEQQVEPITPDFKVVKVRDIFTKLVCYDRENSEKELLKSTRQLLKFDFIESFSILLSYDSLLSNDIKYQVISMVTVQGSSQWWAY